MPADIDVDSIREDVERLCKSQRDIQRQIQRKKLLLLKALPRSYGFADMDTLIHALARFASSPLRQRIGAATDSRHPHRARRYGAEVRVAVRKALEAGESASDISRMYGASAATIAIWKKTWGLTSKRRRNYARHEPSASGGASADASTDAPMTPAPN